MIHRRRAACCLSWLACIVAVCTTIPLRAEFLVGTASTNITPDLPVALDGQFRLRLANNVESPVTANVIAIESREGPTAADAVVLVSCDLVYIRDSVRQRVRAEVKKRVPDLDPMKVVLLATHTHTAPVTRAGRYPIPPNATQVDEYVEFLGHQIGGAVATAWKHRQPGTVSWGLADAVVAYNRRAAYRDGHAQMYGPTNGANFRGLEGYEDHDINSLFFWNADGQLIGTFINVSCTAQEVEGRSAVNADFWHPVRESLHERFGDQAVILGSVGAAGDQSPHLMYRKAADERMRKLRGLTRLEEIARRVVRAIGETYDTIQNDRHGDPPLVHKMATVALPMRVVTDTEYAEAKAEADKAAAAIKKDPNAAKQQQMRFNWYSDVVKRYEAQKSNPQPSLPVELHAIRIGGVALCTNRFELFTEFGIRIKARSSAEQTIVVQLAGPGTYLPTTVAVHGGHYSAIVESNLVGPEGGQILVDRTVDMVNSLWKSPN